MRARIGCHGLIGTNEEPHVHPLHPNIESRISRLGHVELLQIGDVGHPWYSAQGGFRNTP